MSLMSRRSKGFTYYRRENKFRRRLLHFLRFLILLYLVFQLVSIIIVTPYRVHNVSMEPAIPSGSRSISVPLLYGIHIPFTDRSIPGISQPRRGDIVVCTASAPTVVPWYLRIADSITSFFTLGKVRLSTRLNQSWSTDTAIKRIIGIPGDTIRFKNHTAFIRPEGKNSFFSEFEIIQKSYSTMIDPLPEDWLPEFPFSGTKDEIILGEDEYYLLGDNRTSSRDSTRWGPVNRVCIRSRLVLSYLPGFKLH